MVVLKSIDIFSLAKITALFGIVVGLIYGILFALIGAAIGLSKGVPGIEALGLLSIIVFPIIFAIFWFIFGAIVALLYNYFAGAVGGVQIELVEK